MPIPFTCPHCGSSTMVADQYVGQSGACAHCGAWVTVGAGALPATGRDRSWITTGLVLLLGLAAAAAIVYVVFNSNVVDTHDVIACRGNLESIGQALEAYHDDHGCYPPPWLSDTDGKPAHSWRVLLLPYVGKDETYEAYRFDEPWDGPHNRLLADQMPSCFACPSSPEGQLGHTNVVAITGRGMFWDPAQVRKRGDVRDPAWATIILVETVAVEPPIHWMAPDDFAVDAMSLLMNDFGARAPSSFHAKVVNVLLADGTALSISDHTKPGRLEAALTIAGSETRYLPEAEAHQADLAKQAESDATQIE